MRIRVPGYLRDWGFRFRVEGLRIRVPGLGFRVED